MPLSHTPHHHHHACRNAYLIMIIISFLSQKGKKTEGVEWETTDQNSVLVLLVAMEISRGVVMEEGGVLQAGSDYHVSKNACHNFS